ncbi:hypothetical protein D3C71_1969830 [compost metagenome]
MYQLQIGLIGHYLEAGVGNLLQLRLNRCDHLWMVMADVHHTDAADEIEVALAVDIPHFSALGPVDDQRMGGDQATRHEPITLLEQIRGFFAFAVHGISHSEPSNREAAAMLRG